MGLITLILAAGSCFLQDNPSDSVRVLIERLRSDKVEERDAAMRRLKSLGKAAVPELERASKGDDVESSARARNLLRAIEIRGQLTPRLLETLPGIEDRLAAGDPHEWTRALFEVTEEDDDRKRRYPKLRGEDFRALVGPALRAAESADEKQSICSLVHSRSLKSSVGELVPLLKDEDPDLRSSAVTTLYLMANRSIVPALIRMLGEPEPETRKSALLALKGSGSETAPQIRRLLADADAGVVNTAISVLGELYAKEAIPDLLPLQERQEFRLEAVLALGVLGERKAIPDLLLLMKSPDPQVVKRALWALGCLQYTEALPDFVRLLKSGDSFLALEASRALMILKAPEARDALLAALEAEPANTRRYALSALQQSGDPRILPALVRRLADPEAPVRQFALLMLRGRDVRGLFDEIAKRLGDDDPYIRGLALQILGEQDARKHIPAVQACLRDPQEEVRGQAIHALGSLGVKEILPEALKLLKNAEDSLRVHGIHALADLGAGAQLDALAPLLADPESSVRIAAIEAIGRLGTRTSIPGLLEQLDDGNEAVREAAARSLARLGAAEATGAFVRLLESDGDESVRSAAVDGLLKSATPEARAAIVRALADESSDVQWRVLEALAELGAKEQRERIVALLPDPELRHAAAETLVRLGFDEGIPVLIEAQSYWPLNALREPEAFRGLYGKFMTGARAGTWGSVLGELAREAGFRVEESPGFTSEDHEGGARPLRIADSHLPVSIGSTLAWMATSSGVLEKDRIRLLSADEAKAFWTRWAEQRKK